MRAALYARYSSEGQREASIEDQNRNCERYAKREGWPPVYPPTCMHARRLVADVRCANCESRAI